MYRGEVIIPLGPLSMPIQALLFTWIYPRLFSTQRGRWLTSALQVGAVCGALAWSRVAVRDRLALTALAWRTGARPVPTLSHGAGG